MTESHSPVDFFVSEDDDEEFHDNDHDDDGQTVDGFEFGPPTETKHKSSTAESVTSNASESLKIDLIFSVKSNFYSS